MARRHVFNSILMLQIALGVFFLVSGIMQSLNYNPRTAGALKFFGGNPLFDLIVGIVMIVCGIFILVALFMRVRSTSVNISLWIIFALWLLAMIMNDFLNVNFEAMNIFSAGTSAILRARFINIFSWLASLAKDVVILASILIVKDRN